MNKNSVFYKMKKNRLAYLFILPLMLGTLAFSYFPAISGIVTSFFDWNGTGSRTFVGLGNYIELFNDQIFLNSIWTMIILLVPRLFIGVFMPLLFAELIFNTKNKKLQSFYRVAVLIPMIAPGVVGMLIWQNIFEPSTGLYSKLLEFLGIISQEKLSTS